MIIIIPMTIYLITIYLLCKLPGLVIKYQQREQNRLLEASRTPLMQYLFLRYHSHDNRPQHRYVHYNLGRILRDRANMKPNTPIPYTILREL